MQSETDRIFCHFGPFLSFYHHTHPLPSHPMLNDPENQNFEEKKMKKMLGDIILLYIHVYHKWRSYDIWFLKYKVWQTEIFVILGHFLPFLPPANPESQNFKIEKNTWRYYHFTHLHHKSWSYDVRFLRYEAWQTEFFVILDNFLPSYPHNNPKNQNFEKLKNMPGDINILHKCTKNHDHML